MISPAAAELLRRSREQIRNGVACVLRDELELAEVWFNALGSSLDALEAHLNAPAQKPMRKLVVVGPREEAELPSWMERKANDPEGAA